MQPRGAVLLEGSTWSMVNWVWGCGTWRHTGLNDRTLNPRSCNWSFWLWKSQQQWPQVGAGHIPNMVFTSFTLAPSVDFSSTSFRHKMTKADLHFPWPCTPRKPSWGWTKESLWAEYIRQWGGKVRGLEHLYLLKPGPCWSGEDPRMAEKDDHVGRNPGRRCTDTEAQEYGRNKCESKTLILSHGRRRLKTAIEWQLLGHWNLLCWACCCSGLRQTTLESDLKRPSEPSEPKCLWRHRVQGFET